MFAIGKSRMDCWHEDAYQFGLSCTERGARGEAKWSRRTQEGLGDCGPPLARWDMVLCGVAVWAGLPNGLDVLGLLEGQP